MITNKIGKWKVGLRLYSLHRKGEFVFDPERVEVGIFDNANEFCRKSYGLRVGMGKIEEGCFDHVLMKGFCIQSTETQDRSPHFEIKREPMI